jgi:hypothetical protein
VGRAGIGIAPVDEYQLSQLEADNMLDRTHAGQRCRTIQHLTTRDGLLRRDTQGTIQYEMENLGRCLIFVRWDNGMNVPVFAHEIEVYGTEEQLAA